MNPREKKSRRIVHLIMLLSMLMWMPGVSARTFEYPDYPDLEKIPAKCKGSNPTITDFATAYLNNVKEHEFFGKVYSEWQRHLQKKRLSNNVCIIVDTRNGYMQYEIIQPEEKDTIVMEMCFWNCADGKHKLVCANTYWILENDYGWNEYIGPHFYVYDNKTKLMREIYPEDIGALYDGDGLSVFFLPRKGKNIKVSAAGSGERWDEVLEWDGFQFSASGQP